MQKRNGRDIQSPGLQFGTLLRADRTLAQTMLVSVNGIRVNSQNLSHLRDDTKDSNPDLPLT